jgi:glycosyltransferase involved in cell wall biosynthesis
MKILMVIPSYAPVVGGAERQLEGLAPELVRLGHEVTVLTRRVRGALAADGAGEYVIRRLPTFGLRIGFHLSLTWFLLMYGRRYALIHCHTLSGPAVICALTGALLNRPVLLKVTRSGPGSQLQQWEASKLRHIAVRLMRAKGVHFAAVSMDARSHLGRMGIGQNRVTCVSNGVSIGQTGARSPAALPTLIYTGRLIPRKRVDLLLCALSITSHARSCKLIIVGDGPLRSELEALAGQLGIEEQVSFVGEQVPSAVRDYLRRSDIFVLPSASEGMSNSLLEAMAEGLAVIAADIAANREVVQPGVSGVLFDNQESLGQRLDELVTNVSLRVRLGGGARATAVQRHSFEAVARHYSDLYATLCSAS